MNRQLELYKDNYLLLPNLRHPEIPEKILYDNSVFVRKQEFHITLLSLGKIADEVNSIVRDNQKTKILKNIENFLEKTPLDKYSITDEFRLVEKGAQKTIIVMAEVRNFEKLLDNLSEEYGTIVRKPPLHITLYTLPFDKIGVPILDSADLNKLTRPIDLKSLESFHKLTT